MNRTFIIFSFLVFLFSCRDSINNNEVSNEQTGFDSTFLEKAKSLFQEKGPPQPGDWIYEHKESGQTYKQYLKSNPRTANEKRNKIYILPLGDFQNEDYQILNSTKDYLEIFFGMDVIIRNNKPLTLIPDSARRYNDVNEQLHSIYILYEVLLPEIPDDAVAYMAITTSDLYPKESWNFVFGQASVKRRVGVTSIFRFKEYDSEQKLILSRTLLRVIKTTSHELCHMLSMRHCTQYECIMNGSNSLPESDQKPFHLCPQCIPKLSRATRINLNERYSKMADYFESKSFFKEVGFCNGMIKLLEE